MKYESSWCLWVAVQKLLVNAKFHAPAISHWVKRQSIPAKQALNILTLAAEKDIQLTPTEFLEQFTKVKFLQKL